MQPELLRTFLAGASVLLAGGLLGCSTTYREFKAFQAGWRIADVLQVGAASEIRRNGLTDCREAATAQELAARKFAVVSYRATGRQHVHIVVLEEASDIEPGDRVYTNVLRCGAPVEVRSPETRYASVAPTQ